MAGNGHRILWDTAVMPQHVARGLILQGHSIRKVAAKIGVHHSFLARLLKGDRALTGEVAWKMAKYLGKRTGEATAILRNAAGKPMARGQD